MEIIQRHYISTDWTSILLLLALVFLMLAKLLFPQRFEHFAKLAYSPLFFQKDRRETSLINTFSLLIYAAHVISASLFIYVALSVFGLVDTENPKTLFVQIAVAYTLFFSFKYFFEKILGDVFKMEKTIDNYLFSKISYRNYLALCLLPVTVLFVYAFEPSLVLVWVVIGIFLLLNFVFLLDFYQKNRTLIFAHWFYFILYLCAFEIAPYFILYKAVEIA